ncbi:hypothetical protein C1M55_31625 (plasmid) [Rhodococcus qingshengii]|uniref:hypothetical protein n=1 Tax=Rhodococcus TaxID=1827 RepID=UPI00097720B1|nr:MULTISPECIES: hypothetical protein [Rhodococcus]AUS30100.1 hypothetical protein C1M55_02550 [Rhodococcus qingshengii]AUS35807.1 hypothetical protein C1M55_31625 [Rhodococcus qingshengii]OMQ31540.1 hypothetical protein BK799_20975 [Rhodococcus sp. D-1]
MAEPKVILIGSIDGHPGHGTYYDEDGNFVMRGGSKLTPQGVYFDPEGVQRLGRGPNRITEDGAITAATLHPDGDGNPPQPFVPTSHGWPTPPKDKGWPVFGIPNERELDLMRPLHLGRRTPEGNASSIALTGASQKQAETFRACSAATIAKLEDPGTPETEALIDRAIELRNALEASYPNAGTYPTN